jgi:hypothetical protein
MKAVMAVLLGICLVLGSVGCGSNVENGPQNAGADKTIKLQTAYLELEFPARYENSLKHEEHTNHERIEEVFCMDHAGMSAELFRICFGDQTTGTPVGYLHTESGVVPITVQVGSTPQNMDEETENLYFGMMEGMNEVLDCIYRDKRFSEYVDFQPEKEKQAVMKYWSVDLPAGVTWEETTEGYFYQVAFYGEVSGTRIRLYSITIDDEPVGNPLGTMEIDGEQKTVSVKIDGLTQMEAMTEAEQDMIYSMMDTINDVVPQITSSEHFTEIENVG